MNSDELEKSYTAFLSRQKASDPYTRHPHSPRNNAALLESQNIINGDHKPIPTAPRAHKKPRLSDSQPSPRDRTLHFLQITLAEHRIEALGKTALAMATTRPQEICTWIWMMGDERTPKFA